MEWWIGAACITGGHASMPSLCSSFFGAVCAAGKGTFLKCKSSRACWQRGGCQMTLLETLALLTLIITVIHGTVDITLQVLQYIEGKHDKRD